MYILYGRKRYTYMSRGGGGERREDWERGADAMNADTFGEGRANMIDQSYGISRR